MKRPTQLLIPAAGMGTRLQSDRPKALIEIGGVPLLALTLRRFASLGLDSHCVVTIPEGYREEFERCVREFNLGSTVTFVNGGAERQDSVANGLAALSATTEIVVIHDAARPFVPVTAIEASIAAAVEFGAATVAIPAIDTVLVEDGKGFLLNTPERKTLWSCQTPQTFRVELIRAAHAAAKAGGFSATDDATLVQLFGGRVKLVNGSPLNMKITSPDDMKLALAIVKGEMA